MIVDRRLLAGVVVAIVLVVVALMVVAAPGGGTAPSSPLSATDAGEVVSQRRLASSASATTIPSLTVPATNVTATSTPEPTAPPLPADAPVEQLVEARRPAPDPAAADLDDDGLDVAVAEPDEVAAAVAVALWSWRFDDPADRLSQTVGSSVSADVLAGLEVSADELERRRTVGEVSWAFATLGEAVTDPTDADSRTVSVTVAQHITSSTTAEAVAIHAVTMRLASTVAGWRVVELSVTS